MPLSSQIHRDAALEDISVAYKPEGLIADVVFPKVMVQHLSDVYYVYSRDTMAVPETIRAKGAESNQATWNISTSSYALTEHSLHDDVYDIDRDNADPAINLDVDASEITTQKILLRRELDCAAIAQDKNSFSNQASLTSTLAWSANTTLSNPITQVDSATSVIIRESGKSPNIAVINLATFQSAKEHISITDRVKYTSADSVTEGMLAKLFNLDQVVVGKAAYNAAQENLTDSMTVIWTNAAFIAYVEKSPGLKKASAGYTLWQKDAGAPYVVKKWREDKLSADRVEVTAKYQHKPVATACAYLIIGT